MNKGTSPKRTSDQKKKRVRKQSNQRGVSTKKCQPNQKKKTDQEKKYIQYKTKKKNIQRKQPIKKFIFQLIGAVGITFFFIWLVSLVTFTFAKVDGYGMMPNLAAKENVFVSKLSRKGRFDLVLIKFPNRKGTIIRRIIGRPSENIRYDKDRLYINSQIVEEKFIAKEIQQADSSGSFYTKDFSSNQLTMESIIPEGKYLVLGDNRPYSTDSRYFGLIDEKDIIGVVKMRIFPLHRMSRF